jgi:hypothetical protein
MSKFEPGDIIINKASIPNVIRTVKCIADGSEIFVGKAAIANSSALSFFLGLSTGFKSSSDVTLSKPLIALLGTPKQSLNC